MILYRVVRTLVWLICKALFRFTVEGREHLPRSGAYVLAPVHRSFVDFALVAMVSNRRIRFMGKDSLWKYDLPGRFISALGAFPVHRGSADRDALRAAIDIAKGGEPLVIFPEGTRRFGPVVEDLFDGAAYVAGRAQVPIVPVGIGGSERAQQKGKKLPRPVKIHLLVGPPLPPPERKGDGDRVSRRSVQDTTQRLRDEIQRLFDEAQAKVGTPNPPRTTSAA